MKNIARFIFLLVVMAGVSAHAAVPVGDTIWLYHVDNGSYVTVDAGDGYRLEAKNISSIGDAEKFMVEDAGGGNILLKAVVNGNYVRVNTALVDKLYADTADTSDTLAHFIWTDLPGGKVRLTSVGDPDGTANVSPDGSSEVLRSNVSTTDSISEFSWGPLGGTGVTVPDVVNLSQSGAQTAIESAGLVLGAVSDTYSETITISNVVSQYPLGGANVASNTAVDLVISIGSGITVPDLLDLSQSAAQTAIESAGLVSGTVTDTFSATIAISNVVSQTPAAGAHVAPNTAVDLVISIGPIAPTISIQHLVAEATDVVGNPVTQWTDRSGAGNHAISADGNVTYPSSSVSGSGLPGLDFGTADNSLELFSSSASDAWLDFSGAATANSGFSVLLAFRIDEFNSTVSDLLGNSTALRSGFNLRLETDGDMRVWLGSALLSLNGSASVRDTVVCAVNYNASTGNMEIYDSISDSSVNGTVAATNFASGAVKVGRTDGSSRYFMGMVGEVKVFDRVLTGEEFSTETAVLVDRWVTATEIITPEDLTAVSDIGEVQLDWLDDISGELFASYSVYRSTSSGSGYVKIASGLTASDYLDPTAEDGVQHYYVVTAVDTNDNESTYSNEAGGSPLVLSVIQHLDATEVASVLTSNRVVRQWMDQSVSSNNAVVATGTVYYPSTLKSSAGLAGLDMGSGRNTLELFSASASDRWLDQSASTDGFCVMVAFTCDDLVSGIDNDLIGNSADGSSGFGMRYTAAGEIQAFLGGEQIVSSGRSVVAGDTLVFALNYNAADGTVEFWDSKNYTIVSGTLSEADFSTANPVTVGSAASASRTISGMVGEVVVYGESLRPEHFKEKRDLLAKKWINRPNIVMIYVDDWAWNGSSVAMDERMPNSEFPDIMEMPNLDLMAANGMVFRNAYGSPQCSPARAALQTGQSNARNGFTVFMLGDDYYDRKSDEPGESYYEFPVLPNGADQTLRADAVSIAEALAPMGYQSALFGKWHVRDNPNNEGYYAPDGNTDNKNGNTYSGDGNSMEGIVDPKLMTHLTDSGIAFMEEQVAEGNPFYLQLSHYAMHEGRECFPSSRARYQNNPAIVAYNDGETNPAEINRKNDPAVWLGMAYELDQKIGEVRQKVVDLGIEDNTYVIVVGDNGYREGFFDDVYGLSQPLHAHKWWLWQAGIRVPMVVEGPGVVSNSRSTANVVNYDFLPTFVDWAGGDPTTLQDLDGNSLAGLMEGEPQSPEFLNRSLYFHYPHYRATMPHSVIVKGTDKVVYFYETPVRFPSWEPIMLFDLANDPGEYHNIYPENPALGDALYADMMNYFSEVGARIPLVPNPDYKAATYEADSGYGSRERWGPFIGTRTPDDDEWFSSFSDYWMDTYGLDRGTETNDFDGDGLANLAEYALGGNPTNGLDVGAVPVFEIVGDHFNYVHAKRNDDSSLIYELESSTNLVSGRWTNMGYSVSGTNLTCSSMNYVTNRVTPSERQTFIRLRISNP